ncbi:MAG TPA: hypothetical protein VG014_05405 [Acidimicrobiales bacterium]|nr:hypothetical protein [Acidimicrobiales bacterium]
MATYLIRLRLPDRPGALGAVASRIGSVGGDMVSIDILQRGGGEVVDEFGVVLPDDGLTELLKAEILEVDGVSLEALRVVDGVLPDRHAEILETATHLFQKTTPTGVLEYLTSQVRRSLEAGFAAVLDPEAPWPLAIDGEAPADVDLAVLAHRVIPPDEMDDHLAITGLIRARVVLVVGRADLVFRPGERLRISTMAELADHRWGELTSRSMSH